MQRLRHRWIWAIAIAAFVAIDLAWLSSLYLGFEEDANSATAATSSPPSYANVFHHTVPTLLGAGDLTVTADLPVKNPWDRKIRIEKVLSSCGCTAAEVRDKELEAGAASSLHVEIKFPPHGGTNKIKCVLNLADGGNLIHVIDAAAYPLVAIESATGAIDLGRMAPNTRRSLKANLMLRAPVRSRELPTISSIAVDDNDSEALAARITDDSPDGGRGKLTGEPGDVALHTVGLNLDVRGAPKPGSHHATISISYDHSTVGSGTLVVPVRWYVEEVLRATPERFFLPVAASDVAIIRKSFSITRRDGMPLKILNVESSADWSSAASQKDSAADNVVEVEIDPSEVSSSAYSEITVRTDCALQSLIVIPVSVFLEK